MVSLKIGSLCYISNKYIKSVSCIARIQLPTFCSRYNAADEGLVSVVKHSDAGKIIGFANQRYIVQVFVE